jgi:hypothetical protein
MAEITVRTEESEEIAVPENAELETSEEVTDEITEGEEWRNVINEQRELLSTVATGLQAMAQAIVTLESRVPSNLTEIITSQQAMIQNQNAQLLETVRSLLSPPPPPPQPVVMEQTLPEGAVVNPDSATSPAPSLQRKRRTI